VVFDDKGGEIVYKDIVKRYSVQIYSEKTTRRREVDIGGEIWIN
jgi:hypothetical protein